MIRFKKSLKGQYFQELNLLTPLEIEGFIERSKKWDLSSSGSIIFPHTLIRTCGDLVAAAVLGCLNGCLNSGARRVIVLGVLHSRQAPIIAARKKMREGRDISRESCWGIFGPLFPGDQTWKTEYSLKNFCFLWDYEIKKRKLANPPELILAYPCLANNEPWKMPGMEQLRSYLPDSFVVATTDFCHHGVAYNTPKENLLQISNSAEQFSRAEIEKGLQCFERQNYSEYFHFSQRTISDGSDVGQVLMYLKGPLKFRILDHRIVDTSCLYEGGPSPSWVAIPLIEMISKTKF